MLDGGELNRWDDERNDTSHGADRWCARREDDGLALVVGKQLVGEDPTRGAS